MIHDTIHDTRHGTRIREHRSSSRGAPGRCSRMYEPSGAALCAGAASSALRARIHTRVCFFTARAAWAAQLEAALRHTTRQQAAERGTTTQKLFVSTRKRHSSGSHTTRASHQHRSLFWIPYQTGAPMTAPGRGRGNGRGESRFGPYASRVSVVRSICIALTPSDATPTNSFLRAWTLLG